MPHPMRRYKNNYTQRKQPRIRRETVERLREPPPPPPPDPAEELLKEWPELGGIRRGVGEDVASP